MHKILLSIAGSFRSALMGAVRRTSAGWRRAVKPFGPVGWRHNGKVVATGLIKTSPQAVRRLHRKLEARRFCWPMP